MMSQNCDSEQRFPLIHNKYKKLGVILAVISLIISLIIYFGKFDLPLIKNIFNDTLLLSLLMIAISREKVEDEFSVYIRNQSFALAMTFGVLFGVLTPYLSLGIDYIIGGDHVFEPFDAYSVLWYMLVIQVAFFHSRLRRA